jgi:mannose-6-phosphate isomerase-like protein (cupin superfamily)
MAFRANIERLTLKNTYYRKVLYTTKNMQLVVMSIPPGEEIGMEVHRNTSQFIRVEKGKAKAVVGNHKYYLKDGDIIIVPPGKKHNVINYGKKDLQLYSIYTPPEHPKKTKQRHKD